MNLFIELSMICNLNCKYCIRNELTAEQKTSFMPINDVINLINKFDHLESINIIGSGEPFCYPYWNEFVEYIKLKQIRLTMTTNGILLNDKNIESLPNNSVLYFSIDSLDDEKNKITRGIGSSIIINNIKKLIEKRQDIKVVIQPVIIKGFKDEINKFINLLDEIKAGFSPILPTCYSKEMYDELYPIEEIDDIVRIIKDECNKRQIYTNAIYSKPTLDICVDPFNIIFVAVNGDVYPCCYIYSARPYIGKTNETFTEYYNGVEVKVPAYQYKIGNIYRDEINSLLHSERMNSIRFNILATQKSDFMNRDKLNLNHPHKYCRICSNRWGCSG